MRIARSLIIGALLLLAFPAGTAIAAAPAAAKAHVCGASLTTRELVEPPDVDVWNLPVDAGGDHELILAVHKDGDRYCYRYRLNGTVQTVAPTIRTKRGERFDVRIVNDLLGPSRGETAASTAIPPCMPMPMPAAIVQHHVGYLNHTIDDRWMKHGGMDTNLHLHGFEGPPSDEDPFLSSLSTPMHACEYHVTIPHTQPPGTYMYHPHAHGSSGDQVANGLDGTWIVEPDQPQIARSAEHVVMLRYRMPNILLNPFAPDETAFVVDEMAHEAARPAASPVPYDPFDPPPWPAPFPMTAGGVTLDPTGCNGASSDVRIALNGVDTPATLRIPAGTTQLVRIVNGTSDSATRLLLHDATGHSVAFHVVGLDGVPVSGDMAHPLARYVAMNELMLTGMSRADILVNADAGAAYSLTSEHFCGGKDFFFEQHQDLLKILAVGDSAPATTVASSAIPVAETPAARLVAYARAHSGLVRRRAITFSEYTFAKSGKVPPHDGYYITDTTNVNFHEHPFWPVYASESKFPANPDIVVKRGSIEEWYLINTTMESHAFHIHQMAFVQEKSWAGIPITSDTVLVPVGTLLPNRRDSNYPLVKPRITKILLDFRNVPRGTFVFHCHMLFHEDRGMMAIIKVV